MFLLVLVKVQGPTLIFLMDESSLQPNSGVRIILIVKLSESLI